MPVQNGNVCNACSRNVYRVIAVVLGINAIAISLCPLAHFAVFACGLLLAISMREGKLEKWIGFFMVAGAVGIMLCVLRILNINNTGLVAGYKLLSSSRNYLNNWFTGYISFYFINCSWACGIALSPR